jgi:hypothetical protein
MRISNIRFSTLASLTLAFLYACTDNSGLSLHQDGSPSSTGGTTRGAGGATSATGGSFSGTGGTTTTTGGTTSGMGGSTSGVGGTKGGVGGTPTGTGGTKSGTGGAAGATGVAGSGGSGAGGKTAGTGGSVIDAGVGKDAPSDLACGPVCAIYCAFGNKLDERGCPTCTCNPDPQIDAGPVVDTKPIDTKLIICPAIACIDLFCEDGYVTDANGCPTCTCKSVPDPVCPVLKCQACTFGYVKDSNGCDTCTCAADPGTACSSFTNQSACAATVARCVWLTQGCGTPALPATGCYDQTLLNCTTSCPDGLTCLQRSINPCVSSDCNSCGQQIGICL